MSPCYWLVKSSILWSGVVVVLHETQLRYRIDIIEEVALLLEANSIFEFGYILLTSCEMQQNSNPTKTTTTNNLAAVIRIGLNFSKMTMIDQLDGLGRSDVSNRFRYGYKGRNENSGLLVSFWLTW